MLLGPPLLFEFIIYTKREKESNIGAAKKKNMWKKARSKTSERKNDEDEYQKYMHRIHILYEIYKYYYYHYNCFSFYSPSCSLDIDYIYIIKIFTALYIYNLKMLYIMFIRLFVFHFVHINICSVLTIHIQMTRIRCIY